LWSALAIALPRIGPLTDQHPRRSIFSQNMRRNRAVSRQAQQPFNHRMASECARLTERALTLGVDIDSAVSLQAQQAINHREVSVLARVRERPLIVGMNINPAVFPQAQQEINHGKVSV
jgi:hypothetical protein